MKVIFYKLSKVLFVIYLFYEGLFSKIILDIPSLNYIMMIGIISLYVLHKIATKNLIVTIPRSLFVLFIFALFALVSGGFVGYDKSIMFNSLFLYILRLTLMLYIINASIEEEDNKFFIYTWLIYSVVHMSFLLLWGYDHYGRLILVEGSNANSDALVLVVGIFTALILINTNKLYQLLLSLSFVGISMYTIILTGSRKSIIAATLMVLLWFVFVFKDYWKSFNIRKKLLTFMLLGASLYLAIVKFLPVFRESNIYSRLIEKGVSISDDVARSGMYNEALNIFYNNPILGVGFNQFRFYSAYEGYSHSTYAEVLSTTGLIGTLIYFTAYLIIIVNLLNLLLKTKGTITFIKTMQYFILMIVMLGLATGIIHFYSLRDSIVLAIIISFYHIEKVKIKKGVSGAK